LAVLTVPDSSVHWKNDQSSLPHRRLITTLGELFDQLPLSI
jgi:hypothetical protein